MSRLGVNKDYLKKRNRGLVLQLIATERCSSRIELSRQTGLTKTGISAIVNELLEKGYLTETEKAKEEEENTKAQGRSPVNLEIAPGSPKYAGVVMGRGFAEAVLCDMRLKLYKYERIEREWSSSEELMEAVCVLLDHMLEGRDDVIGIGVSTPGPVDVKLGKIINPGYFHGIKNVSVTEPLREKYGIPIFLDHDVQSVTLMEQLYGSGKDYQDMLVICVDEGFGSGIIMGGRRYESNSGYPPEIGHLSIDHHGNRCSICGNLGCLETYVGTEVIERKVEAALGKKKDYQSICRMDSNPKVRKIMEEMLMDLSSAVISLENIMNFEIILLGLGAIYWPERYLTILEDLINDRKFSNKKVRTLVRKTSFLDKAMVLGAVCNAINRTFEGELIV